MYTEIDFRTKKIFKEALKNGVTIRVYQPNDMFGVTEKINQGQHRITLEGPHYPKPHTWYSIVETIDGIVKKVIT